VVALTGVSDTFSVGRASGRLPAASVIVPFRDPGANFAALLASLAAQETAEAVQIIAVDNGSTDGSRRYAEGFSGSMPLRIVDAPTRPNRSGARNRGAREASAQKLLFVDADDELAPGYVAAMARALDEHRFVTSAVDSVSLNPGWVRQAHGLPWSGVIPEAFGFLPCGGSNIGVHRSLFEAVGGFPEEFEASEDIAISWKIQLAGVELRQVPEAIYRYRYRQSVRGLFRQARLWGSSNVKLYRSFRASGMPGRSARLALADWSRALAHLARARSLDRLAVAAVQLGYCTGRLWGSVRYGVTYL
jgi:glycosyltransferase involved in cell wall biosynthesis